MQVQDSDTGCAACTCGAPGNDGCAILDIDGFNLPVVDPTLADRGYAPKLSRRVLRALQLEADDSVLLLAVTTRRPDGDLVNLRAPLVVNVQRRLALQVILDDRAYPIDAPLRQPDAARAEAATLRAPSS